MLSNMVVFKISFCPSASLIRFFFMSCRTFSMKEFSFLINGIISLF